jgi:hypothetical protein
LCLILPSYHGIKQIEQHITLKLLQLATGSIKEWVELLAPVFVFPGENEMTALAEGGLRVFLNEEEIKKYPDAGALGICVPPRDGLPAPRPR